MIRVDLPSSDYVEYLYDAFDRRSVRKVNGSVSRYYVYQSDLQIAAEYDSSYNLVARYVYASQSHVPDYVVKSGINYRIVTDHLGSVRLVVRADTGTIAQAISYDEFGRVLSDSSPGFQAFGFAGGLYDHQTSLVRFGARDYDPETGRWLSKDQILFNGGDTNLYGYVMNDPVNFVDPEGLKAVCGGYFGVGLCFGFDFIDGIKNELGYPAQISPRNNLQNPITPYTGNLPLPQTNCILGGAFCYYPNNEHTDPFINSPSADNNTSCPTTKASR